MTKSDEDLLKLASNANFSSKNSEQTNVKVSRHSCYAWALKRHLRIKIVTLNQRWLENMFSRLWSGKKQICPGSFVDWTNIKKKKFYQSRRHLWWLIFVKAHWLMKNKLKNSTGNLLKTQKFHAETMIKSASITTT